MSDPQVNSILNDVLVTLCRSLLQYCGESWPWSGPEAGKKWVEIEKLINAQRRDVQQLGNFLDSRNHAIDWGLYPDYSDLNYLELGYFLKLIEAGQQDAIDQIQIAQSACQHDSDATLLLDTLLMHAREQLAAIQKLNHVSKPTVSPAV